MMLRRITYLLVLVASACIDPLKVDEIGDTRRVLVVDGLITDLPEPNYVRLFYSHRLKTDRLAAFEPVKNAIVSVVDGDGNEYYLAEATPGVYATNPEVFRGQVGKSYRINIRTTDQDEYASELQELKPAGSIERIYFDPGNSNAEDLALSVIVDGRGTPGAENLFRWRWTAVYKAKANPELKVTPTPGGDIPTPEPCSGYRFAGGQLVEFGECTCCFCWSYDYSEGAFVSKNTFVSESVFRNQLLGSVSVTPMHFFEKFWIEVQQLSLSQEVYDFWSLVEKQQKGASDIFQPNAIKIKGNVRSVINPDEEVLGYFGVSGVTSYSTFVGRDEFPFDIAPPDIVPFSCLDYFKNPTTEEPAFW
jgi:hypothetical protein